MMFNPLDEIRSYLKRYWKDLGTILFWTPKAIKTHFNDQWELFLEFINRMGEATSTASRGAIRATHDAGGDVVKAGINLLSGTFTDTTEATVGALKAARAVARGVIQGFIEVGGIDLEKAAMQLSAALMTKHSGLRSNVLRVTREAFTGIASGAYSTRPESLKAIPAAIRGAIQAAHDSGRDVGQIAVASVGGSLEGIKVHGGSAAGMLQEWVTSAILAGKAIGPDAALKIRNALSESITDAMEILKREAK